MNFNWQQAALVSPAKRFQGQFVDGLISSALFIMSLMLVTYFLHEGIMINLATLLLPGSYFLFSDGLPGGQSLGKRLLGISVVDMNSGQPCTYWQSFLRNGPSVVLGVFDAALILLKRRQRLGDLIAGTVVVNLRNNHSDKDG